jgi:hypothetical protein
MTRLGAERPRQAAEERCLSRPVSSGEENRFPALEPGDDVAQNAPPAEGQMQAADVGQGFIGHGSASGWF